MFFEVKYILHLFMLWLSGEPLSSVHALIWSLPLVHPELRLLYDRAQLVEVRFDLLVIFHILAGD